MSTLPRSIFIGWDPKEPISFAVCRASIQEHLTQPVPVYGLVLEEMRARGLYTRPMETRDGKMWDVISEAPCSTEFAITRFLTPLLAKERRKPGEAAGWAMFMDSDILVRENICRLFEILDPKYAVYCVKHRHAPPPGKKMIGQEQVQYARKNWSSVMVFNADHEANSALTVEMVNSVPGRDLHRFAWLDDGLIGELSPEWNWLVSHNRPKIIHFTEGSPELPGYEDCEFAEEWRAKRNAWAAG